MKMVAFGIQEVLKQYVCKYIFLFISTFIPPYLVVRGFFSKTNRVLIKRGLFMQNEYLFMGCSFFDFEDF